MRALVSHPSSSNPKLLPFNRGETVIVLVQEPRNGWLYGRTDSSLRWEINIYVHAPFLKCSVCTVVSYHLHPILKLMAL